MNTHLVRKTTAAAAVILAALVSVGVTLAARTAPPAPEAAAPALYQRLLLPKELPGFNSIVCPLIQTDATRWADGYLSVDQLRRNGFVAGLRQQLHSNSLNGDALSVVAVFASTRGAQRELQDEVAATRRNSGSFAAFAVAGIPGAHGFEASGGGATGYNVAFSDGPYRYLVGTGFSTSAAKRPSVAQVLAAADALYRRVHQLPASAR